MELKENYPKFIINITHQNPGSFFQITNFAVLSCGCKDDCTETATLQGRILWNFPLPIPWVSFIMTLWKQPAFQHISVAAIEQSWPAVTNSTAVFFSGIQFRSISSHLGGNCDLVLGFMAWKQMYYSKSMELMTTKTSLQCLWNKLFIKMKVILFQNLVKKENLWHKK